MCDINLNKLETENDFEYKLRLCKLKLAKQIDLDWSEIVELLKLDVSADHLRKTAYGILEYDEYIHSGRPAANVVNRILSISDLHVPFHLPLETFGDYVGKVDTLVLNGDLEDCQSCSKFSKKYRVDVNQEMVLTRTFIIDLVHMIRPKTVIIVMGNHEYRMGRYLSDNLNEDIMTLMPDTPMDLIINDGFKVRNRLNKTETWYSPLTEVFADEDVEISYTGEWFRKIGKTIFAHPLAYSSGMLKTTEKAVNFFLREDREFDTIVLGHTHKLGSYIQGKIRMYEQGCCCNLQKLDYNNGQLILPGQNGFIYVCQDKDGNLIPEETRLVEI